MLVCVSRPKGERKTNKRKKERRRKWYKNGVCALMRCISFLRSQRIICYTCQDHWTFRKCVLFSFHFIWEIYIYATNTKCYAKSCHRRTLDALWKYESESEFWIYILSRKKAILDAFALPFHRCIFYIYTKLATILKFLFSFSEWSYVCKLFASSIFSGIIQWPNSSVRFLCLLLTSYKTKQSKAFHSEWTISTFLLSILSELFLCISSQLLFQYNLNPLSFVVVRFLKIITIFLFRSR